MSASIARYIRQHHLALIAVFIALSGTAWAANGPLAGKNTVGSADIINGEVKKQDVGAGAVDSEEIADGAVNSAKVADNSLGGIDIGGIGGGDVIDNSLTGSDINESSLGQVPSALLGGFGKTGSESSCDPESETFVTCAATGAITVPAGARALVMARVLADTETDSDLGLGVCRLGSSSVGAIPNTATDVRLDDVDQNQNAEEQITVIGVSPPLPAGSTDFGIDCNQSATVGAVRYFDAAASVLLITSALG